VVGGRQIASIEHIRCVLDSTPAASDVQKRDRALIAFTLLTGARDNALASKSIKHVGLARRTVFQDARDVPTKNRKTFTTWFFPVGADVEAIVSDWISWLESEKRWGPEDALFPATKLTLGHSSGFENGGLDRKHWKSAAAIRKIFTTHSSKRDCPISTRKVSGTCWPCWANGFARRRKLSRRGARALVTSTSRRRSRATARSPVTGRLKSSISYGRARKPASRARCDAGRAPRLPHF